ncbi:uncharacterized protein LOC118468479 [Anopheles albimanus]|uniref:MARVEL domain-containing protein n=1 Tax=Anopheles albimanus TaxID=7167 RepID=A0A8W7JBU8_ANOAL|nr:uncharacterized protein LOC118468479 [Anopheles albimanus]
MLTGAEFVLSPVGVTKIVSLLSMIIAGIIFITTGDCNESRFWAATYITVTTTSAVLTMISYSSYALNLVKAETALKTQHITVLALSYVVFFILLIISIITMTQCSRSVQTIQKVPEPLTILAAVLLAISGTILFLHWRATISPDETRYSSRAEVCRVINDAEASCPQPPRKSVAV